MEETLTFFCSYWVHKCQASLHKEGDSILSQYKYLYYSTGSELISITTGNPLELKSNKKNISKRDLTKMESVHPFRFILHTCREKKVGEKETIKIHSTKMFKAVTIRTVLTIII